MTKFSFIGVPSSAGARHTGQELAPEALRRADLLEEMKKANIEINDLGDLPLVRFEPDPVHPKSQNLPLVSAVARVVAERVDRSVQSGLVPILVGGDCTITIGVVAGTVRHFPNIGLIYFDADIDMNTPVDTPSGIFDGMGMAHILGEGALELSQIGPRQPLLGPEYIVMFGYNMLSGLIDPEEGRRFNTRPFAKFPVEKIRRNPEEAAFEALAVIEAKVDHILVHFDVDVIDENDFPAADVPHKNGLTLSDATKALRIFFTSKKFAGFVLTEFNAKRDANGLHARRLTDALVSAMK